MTSPDIAVKRLTLPHRIPEVPGSNRRPCTEISHGLTQSVQANAGILPRITSGTLLPKFFPIHYSNSP